MELSLKGMNVFLAIPVNRDFPWQTTKSLVETASILTQRGIPYQLQFVTGGSIIEKCRSDLAREFLKSRCNRLFWIDSDVSWAADDFIRVLALTSRLDIVGACYPAKRDPHIEFLMDVDRELAANQFGCLPIKGMGLGFTCVKREVIEVLALQAPKVIDNGASLPMMFHCTIEDGVFKGEDMCFFEDAKSVGFQCWADPSVELGHVGAKEWRGSLGEALEKVREAA